MFLKGEVIGQCLQRHPHQEFLKFLRTIDGTTPKNLDIHCIVDNYRTHKHPKVGAWLQKHPSSISTSSLHHLLGSISLNDGSGRSPASTHSQSVFQSVDQLVQAIEDYIAHNNANPKPFVWTETGG